MSDQNVELVRRAYEAWNRDDLGAALALAHPDIEWQTSGAFPGFKPVYRGPEGLREWWEGMKEPWVYFLNQVEQLIPRGDTVVAVVEFEAEGRESGVKVTLPFVHVWRLSDGLVVKWSAYRSLDEALDAAAVPK